MNLIEQLGGYENTKEYLKENLCFMSFEALEGFYDALLEYRRQHNIFEVGDLIVYNPPIGIERVVAVNDEHLIPRFLWQIRHATDAEIQAGKRL